MVPVAFQRPDGSEIWAAAENQLSLKGPRLLIGSGDHADLVRDAWHYAGEMFPQARIASAVDLSVEHESRRRALGRFEGLRLARGTLIDAGSAPVLQFDVASGFWQIAADRTLWRSATLAEA